MSNATKKFVLMLLGAGVCGLLLGIIIGGASHSTPTPVSAVATPAPAKTLTVTKEVSAVPQECLDALDEADAGFGIASEVTQIFSDAITAISNGNFSGVNTATSKIEDLNSRLNPIVTSYTADKAICRAAGN